MVDIHYALGAYTTNTIDRKSDNHQIWTKVNEFWISLKITLLREFPFNGI